MKRFWLVAFLIFSIKTFSQSTFYNIDSLQKIEIQFAQTNWDSILDTARMGTEGYIIAQSVKINGIKFDSVGVKYKGNISYDSTFLKNPLHISLDYIKNQSYQNITDIKLSNGYGDPSMIREVLSYNILGNYMHCSKANFAQVYINNIYYGLFSNIENVDKKFCSNKFGSSTNTFVKCNPTVNPSPVSKSNLRYLNSSDSNFYYNYYELKSKYGWKDLISLCDTITNNPSKLESIINVDEVIWMLAFDNLFVNLDSYMGVFAQNYYLYKDLFDNIFHPIVWDLNMSFGGFPYVGSSNSSMGSLNISQMQQLSPTIHSTDSYWPLIKAILNNSQFKKMYFSHYKTLLSDVITNNYYLTKATELQNIIDTAVKSDNRKFFTYQQFQSALNQDIVFGTYTIPGISNLMDARKTQLLTNSNIQAQAPSISNITLSHNAPNLNTTIKITADVNNATSVYFAYRTNNYGSFKFVQIYDNGLNEDDFANDGIYSYLFPVNTLLTQYYFYAENNNACIFAPERAAYNYFQLNTQINTPTYKQIVINEFLANNTNDTTNEYGIHADWIELYNNTNTPLTLEGLYLSDNFLNPKKFAFPTNTIILGNDYLIIWADEMSSIADLHCNFKLSASGEQIILSNNNNLIIDSITFGQQVANMSMARCPNGTGNFLSQTKTSFKSKNCDNSSVKNLFNLDGDKIKIFPNPTAEYLYYITTPNDLVLDKIFIVNFLGEKLIEVSECDEKRILISNLPTGIYSMFFVEKTGISTIKKLIKQ